MSRNDTNTFTVPYNSVYLFSGNVGGPGRDGGGGGGGLNEGRAFVGGVVVGWFEGRGVLAERATWLPAKVGHVRIVPHGRTIKRGACLCSLAIVN